MLGVVEIVRRPPVHALRKAVRAVAGGRRFTVAAARSGAVVSRRAGSRTAGAAPSRLGMPRQADVPHVLRVMLSRLEVVQEQRQVLRLGRGPPAESRRSPRRTPCLRLRRHVAARGRRCRQAAGCRSAGGTCLLVVDAYVAIDQVVRRSRVGDRFRQVMEDQASCGKDRCGQSSANR